MPATRRKLMVSDRRLYGQLYFLDPDETVNERVNHPLHSEITTSTMKLLEFIILAQNRYVQVIYNEAKSIGRNK